MQIKNMCFAVTLVEFIDSNVFPYEKLAFTQFLEWCKLPITNFLFMILLKGIFMSLKTPLKNPPLSLAPALEISRNFARFHLPPISRTIPKKGVPRINDFDSTFFLNA